MDFGVFFGALIISYALCAFIIATTVGDLLPPDTWTGKGRWKGLMAWAVALAFFITAYVSD